MHFHSFLPAIAFATTCSAAPTLSPRAPGDVTTPFLLVTTTDCEPNANSSLLSNVSATSLFDPFNQRNYLLRTIAPGYGSLPYFNLTSGTLHTTASGPEAQGTFQYNSTEVEAGTELQFAPANEPSGNLGLKDGYLLMVNGTGTGWSVCDGEIGQSVIEWMGTDASCVDTYIQAVSKAPY